MLRSQFHLTVFTKLSTSGMHLCSICNKCNRYSCTTMLTYIINQQWRPLTVTRWWRHDDSDTLGSLAFNLVGKSHTSAGAVTSTWLYSSTSYQSVPVKPCHLQILCTEASFYLFDRLLTENKRDSLLYGVPKHWVTLSFAKPKSRTLV